MGQATTQAPRALRCASCRRLAKDAELTARRQLQRAGDLVGFLEFVQDLAASLAVLAAYFGQAHPPRGAVQQTHAKSIFHGLHLVADRCRRHTETARGCREAAGLGARTNALTRANRSIRRLTLYG